MFTIKHIRPEGEALFSALETSLDHRACSSEGLSMKYCKLDGVSGICVGGTVYVMNDFGKTVAKYDLSNPSDKQHDPSPLP